MMEGGKEEKNEKGGMRNKWCVVERKKKRDGVGKVLDWYVDERK